MVKITLVGITHIDFKSQEKVANILRTINPDAVCLELDDYRLEILKSNDLKEKNNQIQEIKSDSKNENNNNISPIDELKEETENKYDFAEGFSSLLEDIGFFEGELARISKVDLPGKEMLVAYNTAKELGAKIYLIDRSIQDISKVIEEEVSIEEAKKFQDIVDELIFEKDIVSKPLDILSEKSETSDIPTKEENEIDKLAEKETINLEEVFEIFKDQNSLSSILSLFSSNFPKLYSVLLEDRNIYMTKQILKVANEHSNIVAVLGYGHLGEVEAALKEFGEDIQIEVIR